MKAKKIYFAIALSVFVYFFLVFDTNFHGPDEPVYFAYTQSLVEDGDLNLINQLYNDYGQFVTSSYNLPDFHSHGGILFWAPLYAFAKSVYTFASKFNISGLLNHGLDRLAKCAMSFSTIIFGLLTLMFSFLLCKRYFSGKSAFLSVAVIFLGIPYYYYVLFETGNPQILASFLCCVSIWILFNAEYLKNREWFLYGLFFAMSTVVKRDVLTQVLIIVPYFVILVGSGAVRVRSLLYFTGGLLPVLALASINTMIKFGSAHFTELLQTFSFVKERPAFAFDGIFNHFHGIFYTSPVLYICMFGVLSIVYTYFRGQRHTKKSTEDYLFLIIACCFVAKCVYLGITFSPAGDSLTTRLLLTDFPVLALLYSKALSMRGSYTRGLLIAFTIISVFWNMLTVSEFMAGLDWLFINKAPAIIVRIVSLEYAGFVLLALKNIAIKLWILLPVLLLVGIAFLCIRVFFRHYSSQGKAISSGNLFLRVFTILVIYLFAGYSIVTAQNLMHNQKNVARLQKKEFFRNAKLVNIKVMEVDKYQGEEDLWLLSKKEAYHAFNGEFTFLINTKSESKRAYGEKERFRLHALPLRAYVQLANFYRKTERFGQAVSCYERALLINPADFESAIFLGDIYSVSGEYEKAIAYYQKALLINPRVYMLYTSLGELYCKLGQTEKAAEYFYKSIAINPASYKAYFNLAELYSDASEYAKAIEMYQRIVQLWPAMTQAYVKLAQLYKEVGRDYDLAIQNYKMYLDLVPSFEETRKDLADVYKMTGKYEEAAIHYRRYLELNPKSSEAYNSLADVYRKTGDYDRAIKCYSQVIRLNPDNPWVYFDLGNAYNSKGDMENTLKQINKLRAINRGDLAEKLEQSLRIR